VVTTDLDETGAKMITATRRIFHMQIPNNQSLGARAISRTALHNQTPWAGGMRGAIE